jgi:hypothetical protein
MCVRAHHSPTMQVPWAIFVAYLRGGGFLLDLVSTLPFDAMAEASAAKLTRVIRLVRLTRLLKLGRVAKLSRLLPSLNTLVVRHPSELNILSTVVQMTFLMHLLACSFVFVITTVKLDDSIPDRAWWGGFIYNTDGNMYLNPQHADVRTVPLPDGGNRTELGSISFGTKYLAAIYWAASTATTTGVGDISPATDSERAFNAIAIIIGVVFLQTIMGRVASLLTQGVATATRTVLSEADSACRETRLPPHLRRSINAYYRTRVFFTSPFDWKALISNVPFTLHKDVLVYLHAGSPVPAALTGQQWLPSHLACYDRQLIYDIALIAQPRWAENGEAIAFKGDLVDEVIIVETTAPPRTSTSVRFSIPPAALIGRILRRSHEPQLDGPSPVQAQLYEVFGLPLPEAGTLWTEDFIVRRLCFYWTVPIAALRQLSCRYPEIADAVGILTDAAKVDCARDLADFATVLACERGEGVGELESELVTSVGDVNERDVWRGHLGAGQEEQVERLRERMREASACNGRDAQVTRQPDIPASAEGTNGNDPEPQAIAEPQTIAKIGSQRTQQPAARHEYSDPDNPTLNPIGMAGMLPAVLPGYRGRGDTKARVLATEPASSVHGDATSSS